MTFSLSKIRHSTADHERPNNLLQSRSNQAAQNPIQMDIRAQLFRFGLRNLNRVLRLLFRSIRRHNPEQS